jgi:hypothetical protein
MYLLIAWGDKPRRTFEETTERFVRNHLTTLKRRRRSPRRFFQHSENPDTGTRYVQLNRGLKAAMRRAKIEDLCWHDLRRTAG